MESCWAYKLQTKGQLFTLFFFFSGEDPLTTFIDIAPAQICNYRDSALTSPDTLCFMPLLTSLLSQAPAQSVSSLSLDFIFFSPCP